VNRREFLYTGAAAATVATRGVDARAYSAIAGANDRVGLGVIGTGRRATEVCRAFAQNPKVEFRALADVYDKQISAFQDRYKDHVGNAQVFVEYQKMLDRKDIDAVYVATPDHLHLDIAKDVLAAGKNIYLEKPTMHRWHERDTLANAVANSKGVLQCGMQQRSGAHYMQAKKEYFDSASSARSFSLAPCGTTSRGSDARFPTNPSPTACDGICFSVPRRKSRMSCLATARGVPIMITATAFSPTSSPIGPMWRSGC
jgi:hypothetical protein